MRDFGLRDKVVVITGGGGALGSAFARGFADSGASLAILDFNLDKAKAAATSFPWKKSKRLPSRRMSPRTIKSPRPLPMSSSISAPSTSSSTRPACKSILQKHHRPGAWGMGSRGRHLFEGDVHLRPSYRAGIKSQRGRKDRQHRFHRRPSRHAWRLGLQRGQRGRDQSHQTDGCGVGAV